MIRIGLVVFVEFFEKFYEMMYALSIKELPTPQQIAKIIKGLSAGSKPCESPVRAPYYR
jgi:hypothetical protein